MTHPAAEPRAVPPAPSAPEPDDPRRQVKRRVVAYLNALPDPLFALLDAAQSDRIPVLLAAHGSHAGIPDDRNAAPPAPPRPDACQYQSLYSGASAATTAEQGPYLVRLPKANPLLCAIIDEGWGSNWATFLTSPAPFRDLRHHFRHFLLARLPDASVAFFRFYDPRILRAFLPACQPGEAERFFGPVNRFLVERPNGGGADVFSPDACRPPKTLC